MSTAPPSTPLPGDPGKPWITLSLVAVFVLGAAGIFLWKPAKSLVRNALAGHYAARASAFSQKKEWDEARAALARAGFWRPDHPALLRATVDFLTAAQGPPHSILHYLRLLDADGAAGEADLVLMARLLADAQALAEAEAVLARLSTASRESPDALEVLAALQRQRGEKTLADQTLRRSLGMRAGDRAARLRLALLDMEEPFQEVRARARESLWELAAGSDEQARAALDHLARDKDLLPLEADRLLDMVKQRPDEVPEPLRLEVLSGLLRARPERREEILEEETRRMRGLPADKLRPSLLWLLKQGAARELTALHPQEYFTRSADIIDPYFQALAALGRWQEIEDLLVRPVGMPVSAGYISFWRARATLEIDKEPGRARQHLLGVWEAAGHGRNASLARAGAALAEHAGLWDLAITFYTGLAEQQPGEEVAMLEKILEAARQAGDDTTLLATAERLHEERPDDLRHHLRHIYLRLLCGRGMELARQELDALKTHDDEAALCRALAAFREGRMTELRPALGALRAPASLPIWQRAAHAGLLALDGRVADAFQLAEKLTTALLLPEERRLLARAR